MQPGRVRMADQDRITTFINSLDKGNAPYLDELERVAIADEVPIIRKDESIGKQSIQVLPAYPLRFA